MWLLRAALPASLLLLAAGCQLETKYEGQFSCSAPPHACPGDLVCRDELCVDPASGPPGEVADASPDTPDAEADAGSVPTAVDAATPPPPPTPDAATPPVAITLSFGERTGADVHNVTFDVSLHEDAPTSSNGGASVVGIDASPRASGLLQFDLSSLPTSLHCLQATLSISVNDPIETGEFQIFALTQSWSENTASWNERRSGSAWADLGAGPGSRAATPMATTAPRNTGFATVDLDCATIDGWIQSPSSNDGMVWISTSPDGRGGAFRSSENSDATTRPLLTLKLSP